MQGQTTQNETKHMLDETNSEFIDLDFDMAEAELSRPIIKDTTIKARVKSTKLSTKDNGDRNLEVTYETAQPTTSSEGKELPEGQLLKKSYPMEDRGQMRAGQARDTLGKIHFAVTGDKEGRPNTGAWLNKLIVLKLSIRPERTDEATGRTYEASNEISNVLAYKA